MKSFFTSMVFGLFLAIIPACRVQAFHFLQPEQRMVEATYEVFPQTQPAVTFDQYGNVHVVYSDTRSSSVAHFYGASLMANGVMSMSYRTYNGVAANNHAMPAVFYSYYHTNRCYVVGVDTSVTNHECVIGYYQTGSLPAVPPVTDLGSYTMAASTIQNFSVIGRSPMIFYVYQVGRDFHFNSFDEMTGLWGSETVLSPDVPEENFSNPCMAMDEEGFIFLAYDVYNNSTNHSFLRIRRSNGELSVTGFEEERAVTDYTGWHQYMPKIAVTGIIATDLKVAIVYHYPSSTMKRIIGGMEENGYWGVTTPPPFGGFGPYDISSTLSSGVSITGPDVVYDAADDLYIVWADDRDAIFKLYGNVSYDGGVTMLSSNEVAILGGIAGIFGEPDLVAGPNPGDLALAYSRNTGVYTNPYLLLSRATFFDTCENDPSTTGFWTTSAGVTVNYSVFYSEPASYQMGTSKGMLLRDFGTDEQQGSVTLQFYDNNSPTEDFYVALENGNLKGVIRMLGVRNDTTQSNYSYSYDDVTWADLGAPRTVGWHEISFDVNDSGLVMSIGLEGGGVASKSDPTFTSFTSLEMQGGSGSSPYFVDDIRVEAYPVLMAPPPLPASSVVSLMVLLILVGILIAHKRAL